MGSPENIGNVLFCSSLLEKKTYKMYYELSQKVIHPIVRPLLVSIAQDSSKHSIMFKEISKELITTPPKEKQCKKSLGEIWNHIVELTKFVKTKKTFSSKDLLEIIEKLAFIEYHFGEEYTILEKVKTLKYMSQEISKAHGINLDVLFHSRKHLFDSIIEDEQKHYRTLFEIIDFLTKKEPEKDIHPKFKYQIPDAWTFPPPQKVTT